MDKNGRGGNSNGGCAVNGVSAARLHQESGADNSFGGYAKVNEGHGNLSLKKTGAGK